MRDINLGELECLLSHPLLDGDVVAMAKGSHRWRVQNQVYEMTQPNFLDRLDQSDPAYAALVKCNRLRESFQISTHNNKVKSGYVRDILDYIDAKRATLDA